MLRFPAVILVLVLALAVPGSAFGQGAGDDQYQDPFGDAPSQSGGGGGGGGLSDTPPGGGGSGGGSSGGSAGASGSAAQPAPGAEAAPSASAAQDVLPNTGSDARLLVLVGAAMLMIGLGLRLRTIDPDLF